MRHYKLNANSSKKRVMKSPPTTPVEKIIAIGFKKCGDWRMEDRRLKCILSDTENALNGLYAFISKSSVFYVGKTVQTFKKRMYGYQNPGPTQSTNKKVKPLISKLLNRGASVDIYVFPDSGLLFMVIFVSISQLALKTV